MLLSFHAEPCVPLSHRVAQKAGRSRPPSEIGCFSCSCMELASFSPRRREPLLHLSDSETFPCSLQKSDGQFHNGVSTLQPGWPFRSSDESVILLHTHLEERTSRQPGEQGGSYALGAISTERPARSPR